jgi:hypothetical protein
LVEASSVWKASEIAAMTPLALRILETGPRVAQQWPVINPCGWFTVLGQGPASEQFSALTRGLGEEFAD